MVKVENKKLIIELEATFPTDDLHELQEEILTAVELYNYQDFGNTDGFPFCRLFEILRATLPASHELRFLHQAKELANDIDAGEREAKAWISKSLSTLKA